jgi:hypothetical protein
MAKVKQTVIFFNIRNHPRLRAGSHRHSPLNLIKYINITRILLLRMIHISLYFLMSTESDYTLSFKVSPYVTKYESINCQPVPLSPIGPFQNKLRFVYVSFYAAVNTESNDGMIYELERMWRKTYAAWSRCYHGILPGGTEENHESPSSGQSVTRSRLKSSTSWRRLRTTAETTLMIQPNPRYLNKETLRNIQNYMAQM